MERGEHGTESFCHSGWDVGGRAITLLELAFRIGGFAMRRVFSAVVLLTLFAAALSAPMSAQTSARKRATGPPPVPLTPESAKVLDTLDSLQQLPLGGWRYRAGDISHGEEATLDDSKWETITATEHKPFTAPNDAVWFRQTVEVPKTLAGYDLSGTTIWFHFSIDANGSVPIIVYFNGRRVAMGEDLEPIVMFDKARPGDRVVIAVKALHTVDTKTLYGAEATVQFSDSGPDARPNPLMFATEARCAQVLLPSVAPDNTQAPAALNAAISLVSMDALANGDKKKFDESLTQASQQLAQLRPLLQQTMIRMAGNAHIDAAWLWPASETVDVTRRTFGTALQLMVEYGFTFTQSAAAYSEWIEQKYPEEFAQIQEKVKQHRWELVGGMWVEPDLNLPGGESLVRQLLVGKQYFKRKFGVDVTVGWNPDSFGYNFQLPQIYKKSGVDYFVTQKMWWNDTNPLPLKLFWWQGLDGSRVLTYFPHDYVNGIEPLKIAKDFAAARTLNPGTNEMLHLYGVGDHGGGPTRAMLDSAESWMQTSTLTAEQSNGSQPVLSRAPVLNYSFAETFFHDVEKRLDTEHSPVWNYGVLADLQQQGKPAQQAIPAPPQGEIGLPVWNDELYLEYHRGVYTTQAAHKRNMRRSEDWLIDAEKWSSLAWLGGGGYPASALNEAWKKELFNQFHDLAAGSGIAVIYKEAQEDYDVVRWTTEDATSRAWKTIGHRIDTSIPKALGPNAAAVVVWNALAWPRSEPVVATVQLPDKTDDALEVIDAEGHAVLTDVLPAERPSPTRQVQFLATDVPAYGYRVFYVRHAGVKVVTATSARHHALRAIAPRIVASDVHSDAAAHTLENNLVRVTIDPANGCITHLVEKTSGFDAIAAGGCGNQLQTFKDTPKDYDAWNIDPGTLDHFTALDAVEDVKFAPANPLYADVVVHRKWQSSLFTERIRLYANDPAVRVQVEVEWHETHVLLKAAFPLAATSGKATYEIPYGAIERPTTRNNSFEQARFEVPAQRWADLGDGTHGFSLLNSSKYGYDCAGNVLRLTLLRSPTWPDANADRGRQVMEYALYPHSGPWQTAETVRLGHDMNDVLLAAQMEAHSGTLPSSRGFVTVDAPNVVLSSIKRSEDGKSLVLRFYEATGKAAAVHVTLPFAGSAMAASGVAEANLMEKQSGAAIPVKDAAIEFQIAPWEIKTLRVDVPLRGEEIFQAQR
jgi:alpha-mannosidase